MTTLTRRAAATTAALALTLSLGACSISIGTPDSSDNTSTQTAQQDGGQPASGDDSGSASTAAAPAGANPNIVEPGWLELLNNADATVMSPTNGQVMIDSAFVNAIVRDHVDTMTLTGTEIDIAATSVDHLVISGSFIDVYVEDVASVTITGTYVDVIYAGNPPTVDDTGFNNTVRQQSANGDD
ncbi:hypothetical protein [Actinomyces respiraculi]|uniref:hypothetical protein n=1 Tax=Actinomyces respiraculi TaxID=2744574 RepID=UPI001421BC67|nr:hypothetical protein [Actinomyces respiraculi]